MKKKYKKYLSILLTVLMVVGMFPTSFTAYAADTTVTTWAELLQAVESRENVINLGDNLTATSRCDIDYNCIIKGNGYTISRDSSFDDDAIFYLSGNVSFDTTLAIENLTIDGGKIAVSATDAHLIGVQSSHGILTLNQVTLKNATCTGNTNGAALSSQGTVTLTDCTIEDCSVSGSSPYGNGGAIFNGGTMTLSDVTIKNCSAKNNGGAIVNGDSVFPNAVLSLQGKTTITKNKAGSGCHGGGIYHAGSNAKLNVQGVLDISSNTAGSETDNVYLPDGKTITVDGALDDKSKIGVYTEEKDESVDVAVADSSIQIGSGTKRIASGTALCFTCDQDTLGSTRHRCVDDLSTGNTLSFCTHAPTVYYWPEGGTLPGDDYATQSHTSNEIVLPTPTREGYEFEGWYSMNDGTKVGDGGDTYEDADEFKYLDQKVVFYAKWTNAPSGNLEVSKTVSGSGASSTKAFTFTVTLDDTSISGTYGDMTFADGEATFTLKDGDSKTATGLPAGTGYTVAEADYTADGYITTQTGDAGTILGNATSKASFTNTRNAYGSLTISKMLAGNDTDSNKEFEFTITLNDSSISGTYSGVNFVNGIATVTLKGSESKAIEGLPNGTGYTVNEADYTADGYENSAPNGISGAIDENTPAVAAFTNTRNTYGNLTVSKTVSGSGASTTKAFTFTVTLDDTSISDTYGDMTFTDGVATFTLKHGESKTATGLPNGTWCTIKESDNSGYTVSIDGYDGCTETGALIIGGKTHVVAFNNYKAGGGGGGGSDPDPEGSVEITKTVQGDKAPAEYIDYEFKVWVRDSNGNAVSEEADYQFRARDGVVSGSETIPTDGITFYLKDGESIIISGIASGRHIEVQEITTGDFTTTTSGLTDGVCVISSNTTKTIEFINDYGNKTTPGGGDDDPTDPTDPVTPTDPTDPSTPDTPDNPGTPDTPVTPDKPTRPVDDVPQTGDNSHIGLWIALACLSLLAMVVVAFGKKRLYRRR